MGILLCWVLPSVSVFGQSPASTQKTRRVLYNLDGDSCMTLKAGRTGPGPMTEADMRNIVAELVQPGSQVDTLLVCVNAQVMYYPSRAGTMRGALSTQEERAKWPAHERQRQANMQAFFDAGIDPYAVIIGEARRRGMEALLSFRMNDAHGNDFLRTAFWRDHPEFRLENGALNFAHAEVRDYVFGLIEEAVRRYDCDGLELDFQRFPTYFKDGSTEENSAKMTALVERVRGLLEEEGRKRGRPLVLGARVPSNYGQGRPTLEQALASARACDIAAWARGGRLDFLVVSEWLFAAETLDVKTWRAGLPSIPIYAGIQPEFQPSTSERRREFGLGAEGYRRLARERWADGAQGIYLFNFFTSREWADPTEPPFEVLAEIGDLKTLGPAPQVINLTSPLMRQVFQRQTKEEGAIRVAGELPSALAEEASLEARLIGQGPPGPWRALAKVSADQKALHAEISAPAGWHRLELRLRGSSSILAESSVEQVGVGEVFVIAGQSNSANHGEEKLRPESGMVTSMAENAWQEAKDPQPGATGSEGSFIPPFADALAKRLGVPIGIVATGVGATSVREWLPRGASFPMPPTLLGNVEQVGQEWRSKGGLFSQFTRRIQPLGRRGFRAVLWHQGESDANQADVSRTLPGQLYRQYLEQLIRASRREVGWDFPWFVAQASYHSPGDPGSPDIREAQAALWRDGLALEGPDSDALQGQFRDNAGQGVHFSGKGQREHGLRWADKVATWLEKELARPKVVGPTPRLKLPEMEEFTVEGRPAFVFLPAADKRSTPQPWIFYAPTLSGYPDGAERWMHEQFLAAGVAVAGVDVGEAYGSPKAFVAFDGLHRQLERRGFAAKPCLSGRSRGGLWVSSWALAHPERVAGLVGIYPVFDWRTYPGLEKAAAAYDLSPAELEARAAELNPVARLGELAKARIPVALIHGDVDAVVPLKENSAEFLRQYREAGAESLIQLEVLKGQGHSFFEGFFQSQSLVDFAIARAKAGANPFPVPDHEVAHYSAYKVNEAIHVDGKLDEAAWQAAPRSPRFVDIITGERTIHDTQAMVVWDATNLYVAYRVEEPLVRAKYTQRNDPIYSDNDVEFFIAGRDAYYEFEINAHNTPYEAFFIWEDAYEKGGFAREAEFAREKLKPFNGVGFTTHPRGARLGSFTWAFPGKQHAVSIDGTLNQDDDRDRGWTVELAFPWKGLEWLAAVDGRTLPPREGDVWRMDFSRFNTYKEASPAKDSGGWVWTRHGVWDSHIPELFVKVIFREAALPR